MKSTCVRSPIALGGITRRMHALTEMLQATLDRYVKNATLPGANVTLFIDGDQVWSGTSGWLDLGTKTLLPPASTFPVYSLTKTITAACVLRMVDVGLLELEAPLRQWMPESHFADRVTLHQLLAHTSGIRDYGTLAEYHEGVQTSPDAPWTYEEIVARTCERPLDFEPGEGWAYSNSGYTVVKRIVERTAKASFGDALQQHVLSPLELQQTFTLNNTSGMDRVAPGYSALFSPDESIKDVRSVYHPGWCGTGVVASTGSDLCRFFEALVGGRLLSQNSLDRMLTLQRVPGVHPPAVSPSYGLGIMGDPDSPRGLCYGHGGGGPGWNLAASTIPDLRGHRVSIAVLCNHDEPDADVIQDQLLAITSGVLSN
jgi:D-alanyl-D-alanine carboxypeptidase